MSIVTEYLSNLLCTRQRTKPEETIVYGVLFLDTALFSSFEEESEGRKDEISMRGHSYAYLTERAREKRRGEERDGKLNLSLIVHVCYSFSSMSSSSVSRRQMLN
jgi:hypothetical protein